MNEMICRVKTSKNSPCAIGPQSVSEDMHSLDGQYVSTTQQVFSALGKTVQFCLNRPKQHEV